MVDDLKELDFKSLADPSLWKDYETFIQDEDVRLEDDIRKSLDKRRQLRKELLRARRCVMVKVMARIIHAAMMYTVHPP